MRKKLSVLLIVIALSTVGCTENQRAKSFGGTATVILPAGRKLVNTTWKNADLWYLTRPMRADEKAESYEFNENSEFGFAEGKVIFVEQK